MRLNFVSLRFVTHFNFIKMTYVCLFTKANLAHTLIIPKKFNINNLVSCLKKMCKVNSPKNIIHIGFELGLLIKGVDSLLEIFGGFLLLYFNPTRLSNFIIFITRGELSEDPKDLVANALIHFSYSFSISTQMFAVIYLISHGVIKSLLVFLLWQKKLWAYPMTIVAFVLFIGYQVYRLTFHLSISLVLLTIFDAVMIVLTYIEYRRIRIQ